MISIEEHGAVLFSGTAVESHVSIEALVAEYSSLLFRVAHAVLRNRAEAEDTVQETFVRVLRHRASIPAVQDMRVWLVKIAWNLALDRRRRIRPEQMDDVFVHRLAAATVPADQVLAESDRLQKVLAEMERLPKAEKHVLLLSAMEEMGTAEIAAIIGKSESAVRALLFRARTRLRERMDRREKR